MTGGSHGIPPDLGLQQERTALAWRRTGLALVIATVTIARLTLAVSAQVAIPLVALAAALVWAAMTWLRRSRYAARSARDPAFQQVLADGRLPFLMASVASLLCLLEGSVALLGLVHP